MADDFDFEFPAPQDYAFPPADMMIELAKGLEEPVDIAERYGYNAIQYAALANWEPFRKEYDRLVAKLEAEGVTYRNKAVLYATDLIDRVYAAAKKPDTTLPQLIEAQKLLSKAADLDPKPAQTVSNGATYSVKLVLKDLRSVETIEGEVITPQPQALEAKDDDVGTDI